MMKKFFAIAMCLCLVLGMFTGCHGKIERDAFAVPEILTRIDGALELQEVV